MSESNHVRILLVEDNPDDIELTIHAMQEHNLANQLHVVRDGSEALNYFFGDGAEAGDDEDLPRLVLLDLKLPKISGLEVLERLKSEPSTKRIPVVVLTSSTEDPDIQKSYALGANSYIVKPVEFDSFVEVVGELGFYWLAINQPPP